MYSNKNRMLQTTPNITNPLREYSAAIPLTASC